MTFANFSLNGTMLPFDRAVVGLDDIAYCYGFGVYENVRVKEGVVYFATDHVARLFDSATYIGIEHTFEKADTERWAQELVDRYSDVHAFNLKILLIGGEDPRLCILPLSPKFIDRKAYRDGASVMTAMHERFMPQAKTLNMLPSFLLHKRAAENGCYDMLLVNEDGHVIEGTKTNVFAVKENTLFTAPDNRVLAGVTRKHVITLAKEAGLTVTMQPIAMKDIADADGLFLTSTSAKILPVSRIDDHELSMSDVTKKLMKAHDDFLKQQ